MTSWLHADATFGVLSSARSAGANTLAVTTLQGTWPVPSAGQQFMVMVNPNLTAQVGTIPLDLATTERTLITAVAGSNPATLTLKAATTLAHDHLVGEYVALVVAGADLDVNLGAQIYNPQTANFTNQPVSTGVFAAADATSGTAPSITLPNDGHIYMVTWDATYCKAATNNDVGWLGIGVDASHVLGAKQLFINSIASAFVPVTAQFIGTGQTIKCFTANNTGNGASHIITIGAAAGPGPVTPSFISAVLRAA